MKKVIWRAVVIFLTVFIGCGQPETSTYLFTNLPSDATGVNFINRIPEGPDMNSHVYEYFYNGGGVAIGDINNDGLPDLYFTSNIFENRLYLNKGDLEFEDITSTAGVAGSKGWSTGVTMADINADGYLDIYVCKSGRFGSKKRENQLFVNNGNGTFTDKARLYGLNQPGYSTQASFFDFDLDGDLDMFLLNHNIEKAKLTHVALSRRIPNEFSGDQLYENRDGQFVNITSKSGIYSNIFGYGLGVSIGDLNGDNWPDMYVGNDYMEHDYVYLNQGEKSGIHQGFREVSNQSLSHMSNFSMGTDIADINNDGLADVMVLDMSAQDNYSIKTSMSGMAPERFDFAVDQGFQYQYMYNTLQLNRGNNKGMPFFSEIAQLSGLSTTDWSWAPLIADFDGDGYKDIFITNGLKRDFRNNDYRKFKEKRVEQAHTQNADYKKLMLELIEKTPQRLTSNKFYLNNKGLKFIDLTDQIENHKPSFSNGAAYADLDLDGDLDIVVNNIDMEASILKNNSMEQSKHQYLRVKLIGSKENPMGVGAKVKCTTATDIQVLEQFVSRGYQSSIGFQMVFGLGDHRAIESIIVRWPDGKKEMKTGRKSNQLIVFEYENASFEIDEKGSASL